LFRLTSSQRAPDRAAGLSVAFSAFDLPHVGYIRYLQQRGGKATA
jgi:hypothetical protein